MKLLAFAYWQLRRFFRASPYDDGYSDWKALAVICVAHIVLVLSVIGMVSTSLGHRVLITSRTSTLVFACLLSSAVTAANYYALRRHNKWARFEAEFESYAALARTMGAIVVASLLVLIVAAGVVTKNALNNLPG